MLLCYLTQIAMCLFFLLFALGVDRVNLTLSIHPDEIPELNEVFTVELTNVTERNERIRPGAVNILSMFLSISFL